MGTKAGIFSGSFNPIHNGHMAIARALIEQGTLDEIWFIASPQNPLKSQADLLDDATRAHLVQLAIEGEKGLRYCDIEMHLPRPSYTITTLQELAHRLPTPISACSSARTTGPSSTAGNRPKRLSGNSGCTSIPAPDFRSTKPLFRRMYISHRHR